MTLAVVTGGGHGIGRALCRRLRRDGATLVVVDCEEDAARKVAEEVGGLVRIVNVADEEAVVGLVESVECDVGPVDLFVSNAGVAYGDGASGAISREGGMRPIDDRWEACWQVNVMAHVYAARALVPRMLARGGGRLINVASAAGLLVQVGDSAYSATKHAAVSFAESLAIDYGERGIDVSVVCPQAVATRLIGIEDDSHITAGGFGGNDIDGVMTADEVADIIIDEAMAGRFLILTHPRAALYLERKAADRDRWIAGMRRFRERLGGND